MSNFITVQFDAMPAMSNPTSKREATPFLRGTIVGVPAGLEALSGQRLQVWGDTDPKVLAHKGKIVEMVGSVTDKISVERGEGDSGREVYRFANVSILREYTAEEQAAAAAKIMMAQLSGLASTAARKVKPTVASALLDAAAQAPVAGQVAVAGADAL